MRKLNPVNKYVSNIELEKNEILQRSTPGGYDLILVGGNPHSKGGTPAQIRENDRVFSSKIKLPDYLVEALTGIKKKESPANLARKYNTDKYRDILENSKDEKSKNSAKLMLSKYNAMLDSIFEAQELLKDSRGVQDGVLLKDQGLNSDLEKAQELLKDSRGVKDGVLLKDQGLNSDLEKAQVGVTHSDERKPLILPDLFSKTGVKVGEYTDTNMYIPLYTPPQNYTLDNKGNPQVPSYWNKTQKGWFTKPQYNNDILQEYANITGYDLSTQSYKTDEKSKNLRKALAFRPDDKNVTKTYSDSYIPVVGTRQEDGTFTPIGKVPTEATQFADSKYDSLPTYKKDNKLSDYDVEFFPAKGVNKDVKNAFADKSNLPNYDDLQSITKVFPIARPPLSEVAPLPSRFQEWKKQQNIDTANPLSQTNTQTTSENIPQGIPTEISDLIGFRTEQRNKQANLLASILGRVAPPVYTNPQSPIINERFLPMNDLAAERSVNNARDTMLNSDLPTQYTNALSGDIMSKGIEASGKVDLQNYQGYNQVLNRNNSNLQNTIYRNRVNDEEAKRKYVAEWQTVLDQRDKEIQDRLYDYQDLNERKSATQDSATLQEHLYRSANKRFIPKTIINKDGSIRYQYVPNPNWSPSKKTTTWYNNTDQLDQVAEILKRYSPEEQKNIIEYLKVLKSYKK